MGGGGGKNDELFWTGGGGGKKGWDIIGEHIGLGPHCDCCWKPGIGMQPGGQRGPHCGWHGPHGLFLQFLPPILFYFFNLIWSFLKRVFFFSNLNSKIIMRFTCNNFKMKTEIFNHFALPQ